LIDTELQNRGCRARWKSLLKIGSASRQECDQRRHRAIVVITHCGHHAIVITSSPSPRDAKHAGVT
jgi:hypothetical protein